MRADGPPERAAVAIAKGVAKTRNAGHVAVRLRAQAAEIHARLGGATSAR